MPVDRLVASLAFFAGVSSFFSPCSVGLLPAYIGYFLSTRGSAGTPPSLPRQLLTGLKLGVAASTGFFALLVLIAGLVALVPYRAFADALPYISLAIGALIMLLGLLMLANRAPTLPLRIQLSDQNRQNVFLFGFAYALASLGCTFPVFFFVLFGGSLAPAVDVGDRALTGAVSLILYALGMSLVMVAITIGLTVSKEGVARFLRRVVPHVNRAAALLMVIAGAIVIYYWVNTLYYT